MAVRLDRTKKNWMGYIKTELHSLTCLGDDWDSYGSPPIHPDLINDAHCFGSFIHINYPGKYYPPVIVPISGGELQFEWRRPKGFFRRKRYFEIEFDKPGHMNMLYENNGKFQTWSMKLHDINFWLITIKILNKVAK